MRRLVGLAILALGSLSALSLQGEGNKKRHKRAVLFASITEAQHEALRYIAFTEKRSIADVAREAISEYIRRKAEQYPSVTVEATVLEELQVRRSTLTRARP